jgi:hypothetical protein
MAVTERGVRTHRSVTRAAREGGNSWLLAFSAGEQAYVLLDLHRPADALAMVQAA